MRRLLNTGHREAVDADLSNYCSEIPHAELLRSVVRHVSDGRLPGWIGTWPKIAVKEDVGQGGKRRTNRPRRERKCMPQRAPISPPLSNIYMRRFIPGWNTLGHARRFGAAIADYADDFVVCGRGPANAMRAGVNPDLRNLRDRCRVCLTDFKVEITGEFRLSLQRGIHGRKRKVAHGNPADAPATTLGARRHRRQPPVADSGSVRID